MAEGQCSETEREQERQLYNKKDVPHVRRRKMYILLDYKDNNKRRAKYLCSKRLSINETSLLRE
jgi:hypothetical protein